MMLVYINWMFSFPGLVLCFPIRAVLILEGLLLSKVLSLLFLSPAA
jgi:hypothetical protein